jgi:hypothetical protein
VVGSNGKPDFGDSPDEQFSPDEEFLLDEEFPLGDGVAETEATVTCPYCGEFVDVAVDPGSGAVQEYVEDCPVCCRPWQVTIRYEASGAVDVTLEMLDDSAD